MIDEGSNTGVPATVSFAAFESQMARAEKVIHKLWVALVVAVVGLVATNALWILLWVLH